MSITEEKMLVAPCGISCGHCYFYRIKDNPAVVEFLVSLGFTREKVKYCPGCRPIEGKCLNAGCTKETLYNGLSGEGSTCATYQCSIEHGVDFCYECAEFPCVKLQPCTDMAAELPHNLKVFYLCYLKNQGLTKFLKKYPELGSTYYFGKMAVGKGPQLSDEELQAIQAKVQSSLRPNTIVGKKDNE